MKRMATWMTLTIATAAAACGGDKYGAYDADYGITAPPSGEEFAEWTENPFIDAAEDQVSTFSIDVDTASFTLARDSLRNGTMPLPGSIRTEEFINYFDFDYPEPTDGKPFSINVEAGPSYFGAMSSEGDAARERHMLKIGLRGKHVPRDEMKSINTIFLVDVSGSMEGEKLQTVMDALHTLTNHLKPDDTVGIVTYAGDERVLLEPTPAGDADRIHRIINKLDDGDGGSTNAEAGIVKAFELLESVKDENSNNRVVILTDGDFNVGLYGDALVDAAAVYREKHMSITCIGVGRGNFKDAQMESLAQQVNGNYFYMDSTEEAYRIFGHELASTFEVVAADVKIQVEFNADSVERYRLLGYETRLLADEDFDDDAKDAGEIGPDHRVTALYEVELSPEAPADALLASVRLRYKEQYGEDSQGYSQDLKMANVTSTFEETTPDFQFAAAVAEFAEVLRQSDFSEGTRYAEILEIAQGAQTADVDGAALIELVELARDL